MVVRATFHWISCTLFTLGLAGCGNADDDTTSGADKSDDSTEAIHLAFIPKTDNNLVFRMGNQGAQFGARDLGHDHDVKIDVEYLAPAELDPSRERELIRTAIKDKKDGLIVSCVDDTISKPIDEAVKAGIPVITYDSDCPDSQRLGFYSMSSEDTGGKAADLLASAVGSGSKTVAILTGRAGADNLERRMSGFTDRLSSKYPDISVVATSHCMETADTCSPAIEDELMDKYPDLDGLFIVGLWGLLEACTCSESGLTCTCEETQMPKWKAAAKGKLKTVAYDSLPFELMLMQQGYVSALIGQKYFGWGYDTVSLMYDHLSKKTKVADFVDSGFDVVCPNNVDNMSAKWDAGDFRAPLKPACSL